MRNLEIPRSGILEIVFSPRFNGFRASNRNIFVTEIRFFSCLFFCNANNKSERRYFIFSIDFNHFFETKYFAAMALTTGEEKSTVEARKQQSIKIQRILNFHYFGSTEFSCFYLAQGCCRCSQIIIQSTLSSFFPLLMRTQKDLIIAPNELFLIVKQ